MFRVHSDTKNNTWVITNEHSFAALTMEFCSKTWL